MYTIMDPEGMSLNLWMHHHPMKLSNDVREGKCCERLEPNSDGYYCDECDYFVHRKCVESPRSIQHPFHKVHSLKLDDNKPGCICQLCGNSIKDLCYSCDKCHFSVDLSCAMYPPPEVIPISLMHHHKLIFLKENIKFDCNAKCRMVGKGLPYICQECNATFHVNCIWNPQEVRHPSEVNHSYHPLHSLKLHTGQPPDYSDCNCRLCGGTIVDRLFYHCSACKFSLDMHCAMDPPPQSLLNLKAHEHQLTLLPRLDSFTCNACGLSGVGSPYMCIQCDRG